MQVTLVDHTDNPEEKIAQYASICYDSSTTPEANAKRIKKLMDVKHLATLRFAYATFKIEGISRSCSHQLVRHPHLSYLQESQRYVKMGQAAFVYPENATDAQKADMDVIYGESIRTYDALIASGLRKEDARLVLPNATCTKIYVTGNFQALYDFLKNRMDKAAQWEIRAVANRMHEELMKVAPNVFGGLNAS